MKAKTAGCLLGMLIGAACGRDPLPAGPDATGSSHAGTESLSAAALPGRSQQIPEGFPFQKILCFGDSITKGVTQQIAGDPLDGARPELTSVEGYVPKLWRLMEERYGTGLEFVNAGIGGELSSEAVERIDHEIRLHEPDLILLLHGIVDVNNEFARFPVVRENLNEMMRLGILREKFVIAGTYLPLNPDGFRAAQPANVERLNIVIRQEANDRGVPVADHEEAAGNDFRGQGPDGLHPNSIGYQIIAETWFEKIEEILTEMGFGAT